MFISFMTSKMQPTFRRTKMYIPKLLRALLPEKTKPYKFPDHIERNQINPAILALHISRASEHRINPAVDVSGRLKRKV